MQIYYYSDEKSRKGCNEAGRDYTPAYLPLMLKTLGFTAYRFTPGDPDIPGAGDALLIGAETPDAKGIDALSSALGRGCTLIGFGTMMVMNFWHGMSLTYLADGLLMGSLLAFENLAGISTVNERKVKKSYFLFRCAVVTLLFGFDTIFYTLTHEELLNVLRGFVHL